VGVVEQVPAAVLQESPHEHEQNSFMGLIAVNIIFECFCYQKKMVSLFCLFFLVSGVRVHMLMCVSGALGLLYVGIR
jgi:hypothetical protein